MTTFDDATTISTRATSPGPSGEEIASYQRNGYHLARGLLDGDEATALRTEGHAVLERLARIHDTRGTWRAVDDDEKSGTGGRSTDLFHCHDLQYHSARFNRLMSDPRLAATFAALMGPVEGVQLHHNKLFVKPAGRGSPFPLHQDWPFFAHAADSPVAAIVHLDDATEDKGCVRVVPGSNRQGRLDHVGDGNWVLPATTAGELEARAVAVAVPARAGDVLFFSCLTVRGSGVNRSDEPRTTWLLQVRDPADSPTDDRHRSPGQGTMLAGVNATSPPPPSSL